MMFLLSVSNQQMRERFGAHLLPEFLKPVREKQLFTVSICYSSPYYGLLPICTSTAQVIFI